MDLPKSLRLAPGRTTRFAEFLWASFEYDFAIFRRHNNQVKI